MEFFDASKKEESDGEETEDETEEEKLIELERRKFGARDTTATNATPADEKEEGKDDEFKKMIAEMDLDGDGQISFSEFESMMKLLIN